MGILAYNYSHYEQACQDQHGPLSIHKLCDFETWIWSISNLDWDRAHLKFEFGISGPPPLVLFYTTKYPY